MTGNRNNIKSPPNTWTKRPKIYSFICPNAWSIWYFYGGGMQFVIAYLSSRRGCWCRSSCPPGTPWAGGCRPETGTCTWWHDDDMMTWWHDDMMTLPVPVLLQVLVAHWRTPPHTRTQRNSERSNAHSGINWKVWQRRILPPPPKCKKCYTFLRLP